MNYVLHKINQNERWDTIAHLYYGNTYNILPIIAANPHIKINTVLPVGEIVKIPIEQAKETNSLLPAWKREA